MKTTSLRVCAAGALLLLAACGTDSQTSTVDSSTARGTLVSNPPLRIASVNKADLKAQLSATASGAQLLQLTGDPACGVDFNYLHYWTVGGKGEPEEATAALMVPTGDATSCTGARPVLLYAHGTQFDQTMNIADITDPANTEGALIAAMFAAQGYIVVAPNYVGYDMSTVYHPYLDEDQQSKDMIDALAAGRSALGHVLAASTTDNGKLFISGYSQGGYVAMATHKALQAAGKTVTAAAPMSGPYALEAFVDTIFFGKVDLGSTLFTPLLATSYQKKYGNVYATTADAYEAAYAAGIEGLLPSATPVDTLIRTGKIPQLALFNALTPGHGDTSTGSALLDGVLAEPAATVDPRTALWRLGFGTGNLLTNAFRTAYVADALANPDGALASNLGYPADPGLNTASTPASLLRQDIKANDLRSWTPDNTTHVLLCGGGNDPVVYFQPNTLTIAGYWAAKGLMVPVVDVETDLSLSGVFAATNAAIGQAAADAVIAAGGSPTDAAAAAQLAVVENYHSTVAPFCSRAVRTFFANFL